MKKTGSRWFGAVAAFLSFCQTSAYAGEGQTNSAITRTFALEDNFNKGWHEATAGTGVILSPGYFSDQNRPTVNWVSLYGQAGYMLSDVRGTGFFRGNLELAPEIFGSVIWEETGNYIVGWTLWGRYNFVPKDSKFVPFVQLGIGTVLTDIDHKYTGQNFNFNLDMSLGLRYFVKPRVSLNAEYRYTHIFNANTGRNNIGINGTGPMFGVSWFF